MTTKKSGCGCLSAIIFLGALLAAGGYAFSKGWHQLILGTELTPLEAARVIPQEVFLTSYIETEPQNWSETSIPEVNSLVAQFSQEVRESLPPNYQDLDYGEDISPWLGNGAIAFFPKIAPSFDSPYGLQPDADFLMVFGIENPLQAYRFKRTLKSRSIKPQISKFQGITVNKIDCSPGSQIYFAVLQNKLVVTEKLSIIHKAIATYQGEPALADNPETKKVLQQKTGLENSLVQVYLTNYQQLFEQVLPIDSMAFTFGHEAKSVKLKTMVNFNTKPELEIPSPEQQPVLANFPRSTVALVNGYINAREISYAWSYLIEDYYPYLSWWFKSDRQLTQVLKILSNYQDFWQLIDGEFNWGLAIDETQANSELDFSTGLILTMSDRQRATQALKKLEQSYFNSLMPPNNSIGTPNFNSSWLNQSNLLLSWNNNANNLTFKEPQDSILQNRKFSNFYTNLPKNNLGYFYLDIEAIVSQIDWSDYGEESNLVMPLLNSIDSLTSNTTIKTRQKYLESDIVLKFK